MATAFELTSNFSAKLEFNSLSEINGASGCGAFALSSDFIEHLIIQLINTTTRVAYSESACN